MNEELIARLRLTNQFYPNADVSTEEVVAALEAAQPKDPCSTCGAQVNHYRNGCPGCGAPVCCESCCRADNLRGELAYQLTKQLVIDIPTARAAVDAAFRASTEAAQPAGEPVAWQSTFLGESILTADQKNGNYFAYSDEFLASHTIQLYTHPAPQVPMTDEEAVAIGINAGLGTIVKDAGYTNDALWFDANPLPLIRATEAHHKIGVKV